MSRLYAQRPVLRKEVRDLGGLLGMWSREWPHSAAHAERSFGTQAMPDEKNAFICDKDMLSHLHSRVAQMDTMVERSGVSEQNVIRKKTRSKWSAQMSKIIIA